MLDITRLNTFVYAAETLSFSEAGKRMHLAQSTVSHQIKTLEKNLGVTLFERSGSGIKLTEAGRLLLPHARKLIHQSIAVEEMMGAFQQRIVGHLRIACSTTSGKYVLPQLAARFRERNPLISVSIPAYSPESAIRRLIDGEANLAVVSYEVSGEGLEHQEFATDSIVLIVPTGHPWAWRPSIEPEELLEERIVMRSPGSGTRRVLLAELAKHDIGIDDLNVFLELGNAEAIVRTVAEGYGVSFVSRLAADCPLARREVVKVPVNGLDLYRKIYMVRRIIEARNRAQDAFWRFIHDPSNADLLLMLGSNRR
jgi:DNA-binding transcriptional LysR family regulator